MTEKIFLISIQIIGVLLLLFLTFYIPYRLALRNKEKRTIFIKNAVRTEGTIEGIVLANIKPIHFSLKYFFTDKHGGIYKGTDDIGLSIFKYKKGQKITIYYDPNKPDKNIIEHKGKKDSYV
ncbi:MAG: DUF3592 domain-containing protein [Rickettsiales bacterium]